MGSSALFASVCFAAHYLLLRASSGKIGDALGGFVLETAAAVGLLVLVFVGPRTETLTTTSGIVYACLSGLAITGGVIIVGVGVVHVVGIVLVLLKIIGPVEAAAIHLLPDTLVFINSIKLLRVNIKNE